MNYALEGENITLWVKSKLRLWFIPSDANDYSPKFLQSRALLFTVILVFVVRIISIGFLAPFPQNFFFADITKTTLVDLLNKDRQDRGLKALTDNAILDQAAQKKAQDMVAKNYFAHISPKGITPWFWFLQAGYNYKYAGENLAVGFVDSQEVFNAWLNSPGHKANLVNPNYKDVGTAIVPGFGANNAMVVVQVFGSLQPTLALNAKNPTQSQVAKNNQPIAIAPQTSSGLGQTVAPTQNNTAVTIPVQKVLGNSVISATGDQLTLPNTAYTNFINFAVYDYPSLILYVSYALLLVICFALILNIFININIQRGWLTVRGLVLVILLLLAIFLNQNMVGVLIPHQIII